MVVRFPAARAPAAALGSPTVPAHKSSSSVSARSAGTFERVTGAPMGAPTERRAAVLSALLEINAPLLAANPAEANAKLDAMTQSSFAFFRATADLFFRGLDGLDTHRPRILLNGDAHPQNFGVVVTADGTLHFGLTDFDEAGRGPFAWDVRRAVVGFELATRDRGWSATERAPVVEAFVDGYLRALEKIDESPKKKNRVITATSAEGPVAKLLEDADEKSRKSFLKTRVDRESGTFIASDEVVPTPDRVPALQAAIDAYREELGSAAPKKGSFFRVKDVARKEDSGLGSRGLLRYYVLIEGDSRKAKDDIILEVKEARRSAVERKSGHADHGARIAAALHRQLPDGDPLAGSLSLDGRSFVVRERSPWKDALDISKLSPEEFEDFARLAGRALATAHARSDSHGNAKGTVAQRIIAAIDRPAFEAELRAYAGSAADAVGTDFALFRELRDSGAI